LNTSFILEIAVFFVMSFVMILGWYLKKVTTSDFVKVLISTIIYIVSLLILSIIIPVIPIINMYAGILVYLLATLAYAVTIDFFYEAHRGLCRKRWTISILVVVFSLIIYALLIYIIGLFGMQI